MPSILGSGVVVGQDIVRNGRGKKTQMKTQRFFVVANKTNCGKQRQSGQKKRDPFFDGV